MVVSSCKQVEEDVNHLNSLIQYIDKQWQDKVSERIVTDLSATASECNTFVSSVYAEVMKIDMLESELQNLANN